jgi:hypothetical protein
MLAHILEALVADLLGLTDQHLVPWRQRLAEALGDNE